MTEFISILSKITEGGDSPKITKNIFDKEFIISESKDWNIIYDYCVNSKNEKQVYIAKDMQDCVPIISGLNEKYMVQNNDQFNSKMKILFFSNYHELDDFNYHSINAQLLGWTQTMFSEHKLTIKPEQIILFGLNEGFLIVCYIIHLNIMFLKHMKTNKYIHARKASRVKPLTPPSLCVYVYVYLMQMHRH
jgi:hypothetical protein